MKVYIVWCTFDNGMVVFDSREKARQWIDLNVGFAMGGNNLQPEKLLDNEELNRYASWYKILEKEVF